MPNPYRFAIVLAVIVSVSFLAGMAMEWKMESAKTKTYKSEADCLAANDCQYPSSAETELKSHGIIVEEGTQPELTIGQGTECTIETDYVNYSKIRCYSTGDKAK